MISVIGASSAHEMREGIKEWTDGVVESIETARLMLHAPAEDNGSIQDTIRMAHKVQWTEDEWRWHVQRWR